MSVTHRRRVEKLEAQHREQAISTAAARLEAACRSVPDATLAGYVFGSLRADPELAERLGLEARPLTEDERAAQAEGRRHVWPILEDLAAVLPPMPSEAQSAALMHRVLALLPPDVLRSRLARLLSEYRQ